MDELVENRGCSKEYEEIGPFFLDQLAIETDNIINITVPYMLNMYNVHCMRRVFIYVYHVLCTVHIYIL